MNDLRDLILLDNNLVLVHDMNEAMLEARVSLLTEFWGEIDRTVRKRIPDFPERTEESDVSPENIRKFLNRQRGNFYHGLYYGFKRGVKLAVEIEHSEIYFGVNCSKKRHKKKHNRLSALMEGLDGNCGPEDDWPWWQWAPGVLNLRASKRRGIM